MYSPSYKHYITVLLLVVYIFNQVDRAVFGILMEPIKQELGLSDTQLGFLAGPAMALFYATLGIPVARWADRSHRVNIMSVAIALWSVIVTLSAAVVTFGQFVLARIGVGVGEAGFSAVAQSVIADYHSPAERTRALSIFMLAIPLGGAVSNLMGGWINEAYGWRAIFIVAGLPGIVLAVLMKWTVKEPPRGLTSPGVYAPAFLPPLRAIFVTLWRRRALRHLAIAMVLMNSMAAVLVGWMAAFFIRSHGMSTGELGTWLAFNLAVGGGAGVWLSGNLTRRFRIEDERLQTRILAASAVLAWPILIAVLLWPAKLPALLLLFVAIVLLNFFYAPSFSLVQGLSPAHIRATMVAIVLFFQLLFASVVGLQLTGVLSDALRAPLGADALRWAILIMTPAVLWAAGHFWLAGRYIGQDLLKASGDEWSVQPGSGLVRE